MEAKFQKQSVKELHKICKILAKNLHTMIGTDIKVGKKVKIKFMPLYFCHLNKFDHGITKRTEEDYIKLNEFFVRSNLVSKLCDKLNVYDNEEIVMDFDKFFVIRNLIFRELYNEDRI